MESPSEIRFQVPVVREIRPASSGGETGESGNGALLTAYECEMALMEDIRYRYGIEPIGPYA